MTVDNSQLAAIPANSPDAEIAQLKADLDALRRNQSNNVLGVGDTVHTTDVPDNWNTPGTIILVGKRMVPNGVDLPRADFPDLHKIYQRQGYPHGSGDGSTTFGTPDMLGRILASLGTHTEMALGTKDNLALNLRAIKHSTSTGTLAVSGLSLTGNPTLSGAPGGTFVTSVSVGTNTAFISSSTPYVVSVSAPTGSPTIGSLATAKGTLAISGGSLSGAPGPAGGGRPVDMPAHIVAGLEMLIVLP